MINVNFYVKGDDGRTMKLLFSKRLPFVLGFTDHVIHDGAEYIIDTRTYNADSNSYEITLLSIYK